MLQITWFGCLVLHVRKLRPKEGKRLAQGHTANSGRDGFGTRISWLLFQHSMQSPDVVKLGGSLCCPCLLLLTACSPPKHRATRGHGPDLEERSPAKLRHLLFLNTWKLISGCFLYHYLTPLHLQSPLPTLPPPPPGKGSPPPTREAGSPGSSSCRGKPACPARCLHSANGGWVRILPPVQSPVSYRCSLGY